MDGERWTRGRGGGRGGRGRGNGDRVASGRGRGGGIGGRNRKFKFEDGLEEDFRIQVNRTLADFRASDDSCTSSSNVKCVCTVPMIATDAVFRLTTLQVLSFQQR